MDCPECKIKMNEYQARRTDEEWKTMFQCVRCYHCYEDPRNNNGEFICTTK